MDIVKINWAAIMGVLVYIGTAAISTMPAKDADWNAKTVYGWFFDFTHMLLNMRPAAQSSQQQAHIVTSQLTAEASTKTDATFPVTPAIPPPAPKE